MNQGESCKTS